MKLKGIRIPGYRIDKKRGIVKNRKRLDLCAQLSVNSKIKYVRNVGGKFGGRSPDAPKAGADNG